MRPNSLNSHLSHSKDHLLLLRWFKLGSWSYAISTCACDFPDAADDAVNQRFGNTIISKYIRLINDKTQISHVLDLYIPTDPTDEAVSWLDAVDRALCFLATVTGAICTCFI